MICCKHPLLYQEGSGGAFQETSISDSCQQALLSSLSFCFVFCHSNKKKNKYAPSSYQGHVIRVSASMSPVGFSWLQPQSLERAWTLKRTWCGHGQHRLFIIYSLCEEQSSCHWWIQSRRVPHVTIVESIFVYLCSAALVGSQGHCEEWRTSQFYGSPSALHNIIGLGPGMQILSWII